jgi:hypothetical protein
MNDEIETLRNEVDLLKVSHANLLTENTNLNATTSILTQRLVQVECDAKVSYKVVTDRLDTQECHSRSNNLIFKNVPEDEAPLVNKARVMFSEMGISNAMTITIANIHRFGPSRKDQPRPLIIQFLHRSERQMVWNARRNLKGTPISLSEDFPAAYNKSRSKLFPVVKAARAAGKKAILVQNKVKIDIVSILLTRYNNYQLTATHLWHVLKRMNNLFAFLVGIPL